MMEEQLSPEDTGEFSRDQVKNVLLRDSSFYQKMLGLTNGWMCVRM